MLLALMVCGLLSQGAPREVETPSKALILMEISQCARLRRLDAVIMMRSLNTKLNIISVSYGPHKRGLRSNFFCHLFRKLHR